MVADPRSYMTYQPLLTEPADVLEHPRQDFLAALRVIATGPSHQTSFAGQDEKEDEHMLTTGEQQQLCRIEQELRDADRGFAWRLSVLQGMLRWARPGRQAYLQALAVLAAALLCLVAAARRLLVAFAGGAVRTGSAALMVLGDTAWLGWDSGPVPGHGVCPPRDRPRSGGTDVP